MCTRKFIIAIVMISTSIFSFAGNGENVFKKKLEAKMAYPVLQSSETLAVNVFVEFTVNAKGIIEICSINSESAEINAYVERKLKSIKAPLGSEVIGKTYNYCFSFEPQK